jgi:hypothetical protein
LTKVDVSDQKEIDVVATFQMKVFKDELPSDDTLFVSLMIYSDQGEIRAKWRHAYYKLFDESGLGVRFQQFTTSNDTITELEANENKFAFTLHYDLKASLRIVGTRIGESYHVEGVGLWWNANLRKNVKVRWCSVDQPNITPAEPKAGI